MRDVDNDLDNELDEEDTKKKDPLDIDGDEELSLDDDELSGAFDFEEEGDY